MDTAAVTLAAVDLGSNSFHLMVARANHGQLQVIDRLREMVRLGEGLTEQRDLHPLVAQRAVDCLSRFGQRLRELPPGHVRAVGTNTLRQLRSESDFLSRAEQALGHSIEVIGGREEARLIYLGVAHGLAAGEEKRLVVDIGGGSTEIIVGQRFTPQLRESLDMGCVSMTRRFFPDGRLTAKLLERAELAAAMELRPIRERFKRAGWETAVGSSGSIRAIREVTHAEGWGDADISSAALERLTRALIEAGQIEALNFKGLSAERKPVFVGGVAVLRAVFKNLGVTQMQVSEQALREGLLYDALGRHHPEDTRARTVDGLMRRYQVDIDHAQRVENTLLSLYHQAQLPWKLSPPQAQDLLIWAARLHEIGLTISHNQYQKHGAYLIRNGDLSGFSLREQAMLATLVRGHRRKLPLEDLAVLPRSDQELTRRLCVLLRLAVLVHRGRSADAQPELSLNVNDNELRLTFLPGWLDAHPLTRAELEEETERLRSGGFRLQVA